MGVFLRFSGFLYEKAVLNVSPIYDWISQKIHLDRAYYQSSLYPYHTSRDFLATNSWWWKSAGSFLN